MSKYFPDTLVPFMENSTVASCLPMLPNAVAVNVRLFDIHAYYRRKRHLTVKEYCTGLELHFEFKNVIVVSDGCAILKTGDECSQQSSFVYICRDDEAWKL